LHGRVAVIVNMLVWESRDSLWDYVYRSGHLDVLRCRAEWFEPPKTAFQVMWWIPAGHVPTVEEAVERLQLLRAHGPSPNAFGFRDTYTAADLDVVAARGHDQGSPRYAVSSLVIQSKANAVWP
jgi:Domain of unknown function (DUF3291)